MPYPLAGATKELQEIAPAFEPPPVAAPTTKRPRRRLSDALIRAFDAACIEEELDAAAELIGMLDTILARRSPEFAGIERRTLQTAHSLHKRLWHLRHTDSPQPQPLPVQQQPVHMPTDAQPQSVIP